MSRVCVARVFSREFKLAAIQRMLAGENVSALAHELKVLRKDLYVWRDRFRAGGPEGLRSCGRPRKAVAEERPPDRPPDPPASEAGELAKAQATRIAELERKVGQQQLDLDFFRKALRQVREARRTSGAPGATASMRSSR
jgi:transposase-like protein